MRHCRRPSIMENIPDNVFLRKIHGLGSLMFGFIVSCRRFYKNRKFMMDMSAGLSETKKVFKTKIAIGFCFHFPLNTWTRLLDKWNGLCKNQNTKWYLSRQDENIILAKFINEMSFTKQQRLLSKKSLLKFQRNMISTCVICTEIIWIFHQKEKREQHVVLKYRV